MTDERPYCGRCRSYCASNALCPCCHSVGIRQPHTLARDAINAYEQRVPGARHARVNDATAQYAHHLTTHLLDIADAAMADEGIEAPSRYRVLQAILYGGSNPADVWEREQMTQRHLDALTAKLPSITVAPGQFEALAAEAERPLSDD